MIASFSSWAIGNFVLKDFISILVLLVGLFSGIGALYWMWSINRIKFRTAEMQLCWECRHHEMPPAICPIPEAERPKNCPKTKTLAKSKVQG